MVRELIERLEKATGPNRDLDVDIGEALGFANHKGPAYDRPYRDWARHYTASIDAALTLVPEGAEWEGGSAMLVADGRWHWAKVYARDAEFIGKGPMPPAIALCIAALKARANLNEINATPDKAGE